ncbi:MAG: DcaP family trimeric outer membrane transporter [Holophaga sp.]|jgi:hypothetical protein
MSRSRIVLTALTAALLALPALADEVTPHYINVPGTDTKLKVYGFVQGYAEYYANQNEFWNGALVDNDTSHNNAQTYPDQQFMMTARTSRFGFATITPTAGLGDVTTKVELDFAMYHGVSSLSPWLQPRIRHAVLGIGNWTIGYTWSNWVDLDTGGETVDWVGPVGQAGFDTPRFTQFRYTLPIDKNNSLAISLEDNNNQGTFYAGTPVASKGNTVVADSNAQPDVKYPNLVVAYTYSDKWGHAALRGLMQNYGAYDANGLAGTQRTNAWAGAVQFSGSINIGKDSLVGSVYTGKGLGAYGADNGYDELINAGANKVDFTQSTGWQVGYTHVWTNAVRSNIVISGLSYGTDAKIADNYTSGGVTADTTNSGDVKNAYSGFLNTFIKVAKNCEVGVEYGYESLTTFGSQGVTKSDGSLSSKNAENKVQLSVTATF